MQFDDARRTLERFLAPVTLDEFLDRILTGGYARFPASPTAGRSSLLGPDPESVLLGAHQMGPELTFHSANPSGPPPSLVSVAGAAEFQQRIAELHARNYSVRFPGMRPLAPAADTLARALEILLHQPVTVSAFWSRGGMRAPVHSDDHDLLVVQLRGTKRWYVATAPSELPNTWARIPESRPDIGPHDSFELQPGEMVYLPRGTLHSVDCSVSSVHASIGFTPLTVREAVIAAVDHLSDLDRGWRETLGTRLAFQLRGAGLEQIATPVQRGVEALLAAVRTPGFIASALQWRSGRIISHLRALAAPAEVPAIDLDTELERTELAFCHLTASPTRIDVSYPGGHLYIHRGAQPAVEFIVNMPRFRVREIPGDIGDDVRLSLAERFVAIGFLRPAPGPAATASSAAR